MEIYRPHCKFHRWLVSWTNSFVKITFAQPICFIWVSKALFKWTRKSTQVNASLQNENLRTDLRRVARRIRKFDWQVAKSRNLFHTYNWLMRFYNRLLAINLCRLALGGQTVKTCVYLRPKSSSTKESTRVHASRCMKWTKATPAR